MLWLFPELLKCYTATVTAWIFFQKMNFGMRDDVPLSSLFFFLLVKSELPFSNCMIRNASVLSKFRASKLQLAVLSAAIAILLCAMFTKYSSHGRKMIKLHWPLN
ncbi:hypothetical protein Droror1_Dr00025317 [Drosera rotundifolia]